MMLEYNRLKSSEESSKIFDIKVVSFIFAKES